MWTAHCEHLADGRGVRFAFALDGRPATFADVVQGWQGDADFRSLFNATLADTPFAAFRWETPAVSAATFRKRRPRAWHMFEMTGVPGFARNERATGGWIGRVPGTVY